MATERKADTIKLGTADYAKVAERLKLFRQDNPNGKHESAYEVEVDGGLVFTVWLWKDKSALIDLLKAGVTEKDALRSSADSNGNAKSSQIIPTSAVSGTAKAAKEKDFEKLETIALGRALANLGYMASGEIASSEEMEEFKKFREDQLQKAAEGFIEKVNATKNNPELNELLASDPGMLKNRLVIDAAKAMQAKFAKPAPKKETDDVADS